MTRVRLHVTLWTVSAGMSALILAPLLRGGDLLYRDAVSTPRSFVTDTALGLGESPARAVPQDWLIAVASHVVSGSAVVIGLTFVALVLAGIGSGLLAAHVVPAARIPGALVAAIVAIWNPFVAERLLQGQWSLLLGYGTLGWIVLAAHRCRVHPAATAWAALAAWSALGGLTPTGSLYAAFAVAAVLVVPTLLDSSATARSRMSTTVVAVAIIVLASLPWLVASVLGSASTTSDRGGVDAFAARAEPGLGTLGSLAGLGGIWNADAVPSSRGGGWALVATACLLLVVVTGGALMWRRRHRITLLRSLFWLALATLVPATLASTAPGRVVLEWLVTAVPGVGLFRDTQKWVALLVPFVAIAAAFTVQAIGRWIPRGLAATIAIGLIVAPLPDLAWGAGNSISTVTYPRDWAAVAAIIPADAGDVAILPTGSNRRYAFTDGRVSLDPAARTFRAPVLATGELSVDGAAIDSARGSRAGQVDDALRRGASPRELARLGVGWILVEATGPPGDRASGTLSDLRPVFRGELLTLYRIDAPDVVRASDADRTLAWAAHVVWLATILGGAGTFLVIRIRFRRGAVGDRRRLVQWSV